MTHRAGMWDKILYELIRNSDWRIFKIGWCKMNNTQRHIIRRAPRMASIAQVIQKVACFSFKAISVHYSLTCIALGRFVVSLGFNIIQ
jgi:hypothetical protein